MRQFIKSSFLWQFAGGFVLGSVGLVALHVPQTADAPSEPVAAAAQR